MFIADLFKPRWWLEAEKDCLTNAVNDFGAVAGEMALKSATNSKPKMGKVTLTNSLGRLSRNFTMTFKDGYSRCS
jgi:hypothetical protein